MHMLELLRRKITHRANNKIWKTRKYRYNRVEQFGFTIYYSTLARNHKFKHGILHTERGLYWRGWYKIVMQRLVCL